MLQKMGVNAFLAYLGLTKNDAINVLLSAITRRVYINGFHQASSFESASDEVKRILHDRSYRKMLSDTGRKLRARMFQKREMGTLLIDALGEHSVTLRSLADQLNYSEGGVIIDDDTVNVAVGELIDLLRTTVGMGLTNDEDDITVTPNERAPASQVLSDALKNVANGCTAKDIFPDIHEHLTCDCPETAVLKL